MKKLLILGAGILQLATILKAKELGYYTIVADGDREALGLKFADKPVIADITNPDKMLELAKKERIDGVIHPCSEVAMNSMGCINDVLGLHGIGLEVVKKATNKALMRKAFEMGKAPSPKSIAAKNDEEAMKAFSEIKGNVIVKPSRNSGSRGVSFINKGTGPNDFLTAFHRALAESRDASVVIEQFVDGPEFSVEMLVWGNQIKVLAVTDKYTTNVPYFVELGHCQPSQFSPSDVKKITDAAISGVKALNLCYCAAHAEVKLTQEGPYIMEIGARLGGDFISNELVHISTGIDMVACAVNIALGLEPDLTLKSKPKAVAIRYIVPEPGKVKSIESLDEYLKNTNIYDFQVYVKIGDRINSLHSSADRSGHIITTGNEVKQAIDLADTIVKKIIKTE